MHFHWLGRAVLVAASVSLSLSLHASPGQLDPQFGVGGVVRIPSDVPVATTVLAAARQPDGKVVVVGEAREGDSQLRRAVVARLNVDGSVDASFGHGGSLVVDHPQYGGLNGRATAVSVAGDKIFVSLQWDWEWRGAMMRLLPDGSPDPEFRTADANGIAWLEGQPAGMLSASSDGSVVIGTSNTPPSIYRYDSYGYRDYTFGGYGSVESYMFQMDRIHALLVGSDGSVFVGGSADSYGLENRNFVVGKMSASGMPDEAFGDHARVAIDFAQGNDDVFALTEDAQGRILAAGRASWMFGYEGSEATGFGLARIDRTTGALDSTFGTGGKLQLDVIVDGDRAMEAATPRVLAVTDSGDILAAGESTALGTDHSRGILARVDAGGRPVATFGTRGVVLTSPDATESFVGVSPGEGTTLAVGSRIAATEDAAILSRLYSSVDGATDGVAHVSQGIRPGETLARRFTVAADGSIYLVGRAADFTRVTKLLPTGSVDPSFGAAGVVEFNDPSTRYSGTAIAVSPDGSLFVASNVTYLGDSAFTVSRWSLRKVRPDGSIDAGFAGGDASIADVGLPMFVALLADGRVVVAGARAPQPWGNAEGDVARFNADGTADSSLNGSGLLRVPTNMDAATAFAVRDDGRILMTTQYAGVLAGLTLHRFAADGNYDSVSPWTQVDGLAQPPHTIAALPDGGALIAGRCDEWWNSNAAKACVVRFSPEPNVWSWFIDRSRLTGAHATGVAAQIDGKIVLAGDVDMDFPFVLRMNSDGEYDYTYNDYQGYSLPETPLGDKWQSAVAEDASVVMLSHSTDPSDGDEVLVARVQGVDSVPDPFFIGDFSNVPLDSWVVGHVSLWGMDGPARVTVEGGEFAVNCQEPYTSGPGVVTRDNFLCVRHRSSALPSTTVTTRLTVGGVSATMTSTTGVPPDTTMLKRPQPVDSSVYGLFTFYTDEFRATFVCSIDGGALKPCATPYVSVVLAEGPHHFEVRAVGAIGMDTTPATYDWVIDLTPPETVVVAGPASQTNQTIASIEFSGSDSFTPPAALGFECRIDGGAFAPCTSPVTYQNLGEGTHTVEVRARDQAGNVDSTPASRTWAIDLVAPDTAIASGPEGNNNRGPAEFQFTSTESGATFECSLDGAPFSACAASQTYPALAKGQHLLFVRSRDAAGNVDASPASRVWRSH